MVHPTAAAEPQPFFGWLDDDERETERMREVSRRLWFGQPRQEELLKYLCERLPAVDLARLVELLRVGLVGCVKSKRSAGARARSVSGCFS